VTKVFPEAPTILLSSEPETAMLFSSTFNVQEWASFPVVMSVMILSRLSVGVGTAAVLIKNSVDMMAVGVAALVTPPRVAVAGVSQVPEAAGWRLLSIVKVLGELREGGWVAGVHTPGSRGGERVGNGGVHGWDSTQ